jgi:4a-hydroxytetrahydrobiopterin dehydratase
MVNAATIRDAGLTDWAGTPGSLRTRFRTGDFATGVRLVNAFAAAADAANHHPELTLSYGRVDVRLSSHDAGDVTERDLDLARTFSAIADGLGIAADKAAVTVIEIGLDTADRAAIGPFWAAVLDRPLSNDGWEISDPSGLAPTLWFQQTDPHQPPRQRFHLDVCVDPAQAAPRIAAALAAGGTLADFAAAPRFWVLADPQGNHACISTVEGR